MRVLSIDPGNVTGYAYYDTAIPGPPVVGEIDDGLYGLVDWWSYNVFSDYDIAPTQVIVEDFIIDAKTHQKTREPAAYEGVGWVKGECRRIDLPCTVIGAGEHTPFSDYKRRRTSKIVRLGWSVPSKDMHADAASSLLLMGLYRHDYIHAAELLKGIVQDGNS